MGYSQLLKRYKKLKAHFLTLQKIVSLNQKRDKIIEKYDIRDDLQILKFGNLQEILQKQQAEISQLQDEVSRRHNQFIEMIKSLQLKDDDKIIMNSQVCLSKHVREIRNSFLQICHILDLKYPHICQNKDCSHPLNFREAFENAYKQQNESLKHFIILWQNPVVQFLCCSCFSEELKEKQLSKLKEVAKNDTKIIQRIERYIAFGSDLYTHMILAKNDMDKCKESWYESRFNHYIYRISHWKKKIQLKQSKVLLEDIISNFNRSLHIKDQRPTTLYRIKGWSLHRIKVYYINHYLEVLNSVRSKEQIKQIKKRKFTFRKLKKGLKKAGIKRNWKIKLKETLNPKKNYYLKKV